MLSRSLASGCASLIAVSGFAGLALGNPVNGFYFDAPHCDNHGPQTAWAEIGTLGLFPTQCRIDSSSVISNVASCPTDDPNMLNYRVRIVNTSGQQWQNLFYVADVDTTISNDDGFAWSSLVPGATGQAFRIDSVGINKPLLFESILADGIFQAGEIWEFVIQDYFNVHGFAAHDFSSIDFAGGSGIIPPTSSGSIVAFNPVPAPGTAALLGLGACAACRRRRAGH